MVYANRHRVAPSAIILLIAACGSNEPYPALLNGLNPMSLPTAGAELDRRLARRFPPGTPQRDLVRALEEGGFTRDATTGMCNGEPNCMAVEYWPDRSTWVAYAVHWRTDSRQRVTTVHSTVSIN